MDTPRKHLVIPDVQAKPGVETAHLDWVGHYIVDKKPDVIVMIGDFADMPSLSSYDKGYKSAIGRTYHEDVMAARKGMEKLLAPLEAYNAGQRRNRKPRYNPRMVMTLGNHEDRIRRAVEEDSRLHGTIGVKDLGFEESGWEVHDFLEVVCIDGIAYSHYFTSGVMGKPVSSARALVKAKHMSATMGHRQDTDIYMGDVRADGTQMIGLFCGTCYLHDEDYLGPQGNKLNRRQVVMKHEVKDGSYDPMFVSLAYLKRKYGS